MKLNIRDMEERDAKNLAEIEKECFSDPWPAELFLHELKENKTAKYIVVEVGEELIAYGGMWNIACSGYVTNIAVSKEYRNRGIGTRILNELTRICIESGWTMIILEVRKSNLAAQELYEKMGFVAIDIKEGYYTDNNEDAIIMGKSI